MLKKKTILVAPLHWGLGHATRCIPIIKALIGNNYKVILASDGAALQLLQKEFPYLEVIVLPSYPITYPKKARNFKWNMLLKFPTILKAISSEKKIIKNLVKEGKIDGIISDNRFGIRSSKIPSVYITHQLNVLTGNTSYFSSKIHQSVIRKFDECWVPDRQGVENLSGKLGHISEPRLKIKYIGLLSRMTKKTVPIKYEVLLLLSGPEPQRTLLEEKLIALFKSSQQKVLLVQGCVENEQKTEQLGNITRYNFMQSKELEFAINESEIVISRSGYTTIMDLEALEKKAFFIPTPGQYEQEYLAKRMEEIKLAPYCLQEEFTIDKLKKIDDYCGFKKKNTSVDYKKLFRLFECK